MKRKNKSSEYLRRETIILGEVSFNFTTPSPDCHFSIVKGFEIRFEPHLDKIYASHSTISVIHLESKRKDTVLIVLPKMDHKKSITYGFNLDYLQFPTHTVKITADGKIDQMFFQLVDTQMRGDINVPIYNPDINYGISLFQDLFKDRYEALSFYPPNVDIGPINFSQIPQNSGIPKPYTGGISSSACAKLIGYYQKEEKSTNGWKSVSMRFGKLCEPLIIALYLSAHPDYKFKEIGWITKQQDGAQPDGVIFDTSTKITFGLEMKSSKFNCRFEGSFIVQCMWEMYVGDYPYIDLVRFCEKQVKMGELWTTIPECKEIRIMRNPEKEAELLQLCKKSSKDILNTKPYNDFRAYLDNLAENANQDAKDVPIQEDILQQIREYKSQLLSFMEAELCTIHPVIDRIEKRQARMFALFQEENKEEFRKEACDQLRDYSEILKSSF